MAALVKIDFLIIVQNKELIRLSQLVGELRMELIIGCSKILGVPAGVMKAISNSKEELVVPIICVQALNLLRRNPFVPKQLHVKQERDTVIIMNHACQETVD